MIELIREEDFDELPDEPKHKWVHLEKIANSRLTLIESDMDNAPIIPALREHFIVVLTELAKEYSIDVSISQGGTGEDRLHRFKLAVSRAKAKIWAESSASFPLGRVKLNTQTKDQILILTGQIEQHINSLEDTDKRRKALHAILEDFRREINQPKTRIGTALTNLAQISTIVAMSTTALAQGEDAYATIQRLLGAEHLKSTGSEIQLIEKEKQLLLGPPPSQITDQS